MKNKMKGAILCTLKRFLMLFCANFVSHSIKMFIEERHTQIAKAIEADGKITISQITEKYSISEESARRDLRILEQNGICKRTRGGAIALNSINTQPPTDRDFESMPVFDNYRKIAKAAVELIEENDTVYITNGSFGHIMLSLIPKDMHLTAVVNSADMAKALRSFENIEAYVVGGKMRKSGSLVDSLAKEFVAKFHFDSCFITGSGLTADFGLSNGTDETAAFQRTVLNNSRKKYLLMPGVKIGTNAFIKVSEADIFNKIITDSECTEEEIASLKEKSIDVLCVEA